jgi:hypothetical protein
MKKMTASEPKAINSNLCDMMSDIHFSVVFGHVELHAPNMDFKMLVITHILAQMPSPSRKK